MSVLPVINKILEIKFVQWTLLLFVIVLLILGITQSVRLKFSQVSLEETKAILTTQNALAKVAQDQVHVKEEEAAKIAKSYEEKLKKARMVPFREDCCGAIEDFKNYILQEVQQ